MKKGGVKEKYRENERKEVKEEYRKMKEIGKEWV